MYRVIPLVYFTRKQNMSVAAAKVLHLALKRTVDFIYLQCFTDFNFHQRNRTEVISAFGVSRRLFPSVFGSKNNPNNDFLIPRPANPKNFKEQSS
ncbi:uncharacterized protein PHALS_12230 [Plasmopara halstedii]|uniref:Uncharacterized protein n=1 Tax=Plasmopara halstedii TaxID=4781 RepID=A0A0P1ALN5_PLAHL|nr:uncharacterized protein PHALS_12230 [Plasmopara halstedii]CEG41918.1 hypothetical protein PHALS_12230 [Plasmopara halstedii]|eukprot:XP_024578287.1 hypothetical protein PHALS_12230 [Plasmopara halstedii]